MTTQGNAAPDGVEVEGSEPDPKTLGDWIAQRTRLKDRIRTLEPLAEKSKEQEGALKTAREKLAEVERKAARAERLEAEVQAVLDSELADVPDEVKAIVRGETPEDKLAHVRELRKAGVLGGRRGEPPVGSRIGGSTSQAKTMKRAAYFALSPKDQSEFVRKGGRIED